MHYSLFKGKPGLASNYIKIKMTLSISLWHIESWSQYIFVYSAQCIDKAVFYIFWGTLMKIYCLESWFIAKFNAQLKTHAVLKTKGREQDMGLSVFIIISDEGYH